MGSTRIDPYFYDQPPLGFVEELKTPVHMKKPSWFGERTPKEGEVKVSGMYLVQAFPDPEGLLETAIEDFTRFLVIHKMVGEQYPVRLEKKPTECFEAYRIRVSEEECVIEAEDTEGIRRGIIYLEDEMLRREGPVLALGEISRKPSIRERITRGFFSPTNRPPKNIDELMDDVDYYPDEYLNRLAHDGTNGLWIYTHFNQLVESEIFKEYGEDSAKRIEKLKKVVEKCKRYGVKVYVFGVEPFSMKPEWAERYPDAVGGVGWNGHSTICTFSEKGAEYCIEVTKRLMEQVPDLGGIIDITYGERPTTCASLSNRCQCPRCKDRSHAEIMARSIDLLKEGIRRAGSKADFVSWTYGHRVTPLEDIKDYVRRAPKDVMLMENFEDAGYTEQLGKTRQAIDYWLSYVGPSQMFEAAAETAVETGKTMFAKMQVCCSHEIATVPYIPAPGIIFDKFKAARSYGVEGVMECWYFGNYPSMMSKAAGELSFLEDYSDKQGFLEHLAGIYYGSRAKEAVAAWNHFEKSYTQYPINIMFSYYGPMHDGVIWDLALLPKDYSLPRTWQLLDKPDGDRIGECLQSGHTLEEAICLTKRMREEWFAGICKLPDNGPEEQRTVAEALQLLYASGNNILKFYELRARLGREYSGTELNRQREEAFVNGEAASNLQVIGMTDMDAERILQQMEALVEEEIANSKAMIELCHADPRLGYHSEAEGYKFFPKKLENRIENLKRMKQEEFATVRKNLANGKAALSWYQGKEGPGYQLTHVSDAYGEAVAATEWTKPYLSEADQGILKVSEQTDILDKVQKALEEAAFEQISEDAVFRVSYDKDYLYVELKGAAQTTFAMYFEYELMWPAPGLHIAEDELTLRGPVYTHQSIWGEKALAELEKYQLLLADPDTGHYILVVSRKKTDWTEERPIRVLISADGKSWIKDDEPVHVLGKTDASPGEFGWLRV